MTNENKMKELTLDEMLQFYTPRDWETFEEWDEQSRNGYFQVAITKSLADIANALSRIECRLEEVSHTISMNS